MQNNQAATLPIAFVRDLFAALSGSITVDDADFLAFPERCQVSASFGISHSPNDIAEAVNSVWPYPESSPHVGAIVAIRGNGVNINRYTAIQGELSRKMHDSSLLLINVSKSTKLPPGSLSITLLAIAHAPG